MLPIPSSTPLLAYLDPVTGNVLVQAVLAGLAGVALFYHNAKAWVQGRLGKRKDKEKDKAAGQEQERREAVEAEAKPPVCDN